LHGFSPSPSGEGLGWGIATGPAFAETPDPLLP